MLADSEGSKNLELLNVFLNIWGGCKIDLSSWGFNLLGNLGLKITSLFFACSFLYIFHQAFIILYTLLLGFNKSDSKLLCVWIAESSRLTSLYFHISYIMERGRSFILKSFSEIISNLFWIDWWSFGSVDFEINFVFKYR